MRKSVDRSQKGKVEARSRHENMYIKQKTLRHKDLSQVLGRDYRKRFFLSVRRIIRVPSHRHPSSISYVFGISVGVRERDRKMFCFYPHTFKLGQMRFYEGDEAVR